MMSCSDGGPMLAQKAGSEQIWQIKLNSLACFKLFDFSQLLARSLDDKVL